MAADVLYVPFIQVLVGNLNVLEIKIKNYWDDTHSYTVEIIASSKYHQATCLLGSRFNMLKKIIINHFRKKK